MTSQYVTEPPTSGHIVLVTSKGEIEIELFAKEAPKACRNLLTLALEGFYDDQVFHRLIPGFMIQTGDPSGTGMGGESIYGEPFPIEPHSRLKFNRRGMVAMAAEEATNESQFFITLDATPELQGKHTIIGKVVGNTIYNLLELAQGEMDKNKPDRPRYPPRLLHIKVISHPYDNLKPRFTKESRLEEANRRKEAMQHKQREAKTKVKKNTSLLSFGGDEEADEGTVLKGSKSSHDLLPNDKKLSRKSAKDSSRETLEPFDKPEQKRRKDASPIPDPSPSKVREAMKTNAKSNPEASSSTEDRIKVLEAEIRGVSGSSSRIDREPKASKPKSSTGKDFLMEARQKYAKGLDKADSYDALLSFQDRIRSVGLQGKDQLRSANPAIVQQELADEDDEEEEEEEEAKEYGASDDDDDWRNHRLDAGGQPIVGNDKYSIEDYEVLDPREHAKLAKEEKDNVNGQGKRGRDWVEDRRSYRDRDHQPSSSSRPSTTRDWDRNHPRRTSHSWQDDNTQRNHQRRR